MADVFLSYASEDRDRVRPLAEALQARGFSVWWDRSLAAGDDFSAVIQRELVAAKAVIVVWTNTSAASVWVRDEAGRARDDGRLIPIMLDQVQIPLGFGAFQAEDFTGWNGAASAAQIQLLEEALKAKLEGRGIDGASVAAKRRRLMDRIRVVSVLTVAASVIGIVAGVNTILRPQQPQIVQQDHMAELLALVREGKITPDQAIQLAQLLESQTFAEASASPSPPAAASGRRSDDAASEPAPPSPSDSSSSAMLAAPAPGGETVQVAAVTEEAFDAAARQTYRADIRTLLAHNDARVRTAAIQLARPATRDGAMRTLWAYAENHPGPEQAAIYRVCGAVGQANNHPLALQALERARAASPQDSNVWRMLSFSLRRANRTEDAAAAALVTEGLDAQARGNGEVAETRLEQALPTLQAPETRAFIEGQLGDAAARRQDWVGAAERYQSAFAARRTTSEGAPATPALEIDAQKLVLALDRGGRTDEACRAVEEARQAGVSETDANVTQRCERMRLIRPRPEVRPELRLQRNQVPIQQHRANDPAAPAPAN